MNLFNWDMPKLKIDKPVRLIELFAGIGAQAKALERLGIPFERYVVCEFDRFAIASYNAVHGTDFKTMDICDMKGKDLGIVDTDKYCYILTYSFPCVDLSVAGRGKGMKKGTRSGLLWEVERLLNECDEYPQIMLMENVPMVVADKNIEDFAEWCGYLEKKGYTNEWAVLNSKDFGIPQNRERCFMISFLGRYQYEFPEPIKLKNIMDDILENDVDDKYYLKGETAERICTQLIHTEKQKDIDRENSYGISMCKNGYDKRLKVARTVEARYYKGIANQLMNGVAHEDIRSASNKKQND